MLTCVFGLTACNGEKETLSYEAGTITSQCEALYQRIATDNEDYSKYNDYMLEDLSNEIFVEDGIHIDGKTLVTAIDSYHNAFAEMGEIHPIAGDISFDAKEEELIVTYGLDGSTHDGSIEIIYDKNLKITSVTTNTAYSFEELMAKAGMNTAIGMGTVFAMLIIIMFIIMLLGLVPKIFEKKPAAVEEKKDGVDKAIEGIVAREEASESAEDDTELVAVIAAAIASYEGTSTDGFVVRSIKRIR